MRMFPTKRRNQNPEDDTTPPTKMTGDGKVSTDWRTIAALALLCVSGATFYADLKHDGADTRAEMKRFMTQMDARFGTVVYADELERFSLQMQLKNPGKLAMPSPDEYLRRNRPQQLMPPSGAASTPALPMAMATGKISD